MIVCKPSANSRTRNSLSAWSVFALGLIVCVFFSCVLPIRADDTADRRSAVQAQFAKAEALRGALEAKPERERTLKEYSELVEAYRRAYLITPNAVEVPTAIKQVADLYNHMGEQFEAKYFRQALTSYEFLVHDYPASHFVPDAELAIAALQRGPLNEPDLAKQGYEEFLKNHPRSERAAEARAALKEMAAPRTAASGAAGAPTTSTARALAAAPATSSVDAAKMDASKAPAKAGVTPAGASATPAAALAPAQTSASAATESSGGVAELGQVRVWNGDTYTRMILDIGSQAKYQAARISGPDRIYFDIENAHLNARLATEPIEVPANGYLKSVRIAQNRANVVRVVLEVDKVKDYSVFELANPDRLVVDVYGEHHEGPSPATETVVPATPSQPGAKDAARGKIALAANTATVAPVTPGASATAKPTAQAGVKAASEKPAAIREVKANVGDAKATAASVAAPTKNAAQQRASDEPKPVAVLAKAAASDAPKPTAQPTLAGQRSLTRVLGLKVGRIVIDAGHGGHDTGTIGPTGLMEKDLCLDVALRLGRMIQERLPLAEVSYTRSDDTFVGLEQRTAIANDARSDLLISIHANSSDDHKVRGIETYYLNFNPAPGAMEVAARENATAQGGVHELEDLVQKIARNEKIEESRDLAANIQDSLTRQTSSDARNRGVRRAPFVVLIGANMPSVLTEISFLSNPTDEQWLKKADNRQRIAEGIYRGIESYLKSTNSLAGILPTDLSESIHGN